MNNTQNIPSINLGIQDFCKLREENCFLIDKTEFICEWWESRDDVTLITRPRRFGKTLNMSMLECFFSTKYAGRNDLFEDLGVWQYEEYRSLQGTYPVICISFADVKAVSFADFKLSIKLRLSGVFDEFQSALDRVDVTERERVVLNSINADMPDQYVADSIKFLSTLLYRYYGKKVIILIDEYDTPMQEAYLNGYWDEFTGFIRQFFNSTFKSNPSMYRAVMTGITRISKESVFSDLNNLLVITTTSAAYSTCFGFTENEVFAALDTAGLADMKGSVKKWYDGFVFGGHRNIYNPWSITCFLNRRRLDTYWASTSSNALISNILKNASNLVKIDFGTLVSGKSLTKQIDEQIVFDQLDTKADAVWSLMLAGGYLRINSYCMNDATGKYDYELQVTNNEVRIMFNDMIRDWFGKVSGQYNEFVRALLENKLPDMNAYMRDVFLHTFSSFDTGDRSEPERFYHAFVLGLLVELRGRYKDRSNRESGYGRYDVMLIPDSVEDNAYVLEFKVRQAADETLKSAAEKALRQIEDKKYDAELLDSGIKPDRIHHYGLVFEGKDVLIAGE